MRSGLLDKRLQLFAPVTAQSASGEVSTSWAAPVTVWARIAPVRGGEALRAGQILADMDTRIRIRYSSLVSGVNATWKAEHAGTVYNIVSVANLDTSRTEVELMCKSGLNGG